MATLVEWLPRVGALITLLVGLVGFFRPRLFLDSMGISLQGPMAFSEARGVFGGLNLGLSAAALVLDEPAVFTAIGCAWLAVLSARFWSMFADGAGLRASLPALVFDGTLALLFLSPLLLG